MEIYVNYIFGDIDKLEIISLKVQDGNFCKQDRVENFV